MPRCHEPLPVANSSNNPLTFRWGFIAIILVALWPITCFAQDATPSPPHVSLQTEQQLDNLKSVAPRVRQNGLLVGAAHNIGAITTATQQAKSIELQLITTTVSNREKIPETLKRLLPQIDLLWLLPDHQMVITEELLPFLLESIFDAKFPLFGFSSTLIQRGALDALATDPLDAGQPVGRLATAHLHTPSNTVIRLVQPDRTHPALNLSTADYLGLRPPSHIIQMASHRFGGPGAFAATPVCNEPIP